MIDSLKPASADPVPCKICGDPAPLYGVVDFNRNCEIPNGVKLALSGTPIYYRRCGSCGFLFTDAFDDWNDEQFKTHIYNGAYYSVDPGYIAERPNSNADVVARLWGLRKSETRVLDYGGGNDVFCTALRANGFPVAVTYDPMVPEYSRRPDGRFDLVTCFETLEHLPDPQAGIAQIVEFVADPGLILFTTLLLPADFDTQRLNWWYIGPRNGHVSIFSRQALTGVWSRYGYKLASFNDNIHLAYRTLPPFLAHLQK
jgi:2-polyprenyl-6-hydroxyphenyl methylase/3-demethylubiquinone-9 3-methyltransferase